MTDTTTAETKQSFEERLLEIVSQIELGMNCRVRLDQERSVQHGVEIRGRWFVQIECYRMDVITKEMGWGRGGKGWLSEHSTRNEIVQMIFGLYKGYWEHEARENFQYRGRRVFGPHMDVDQIWTVANKVDVRSMKHVEDQDPVVPVLQALADQSQEELREQIRLSSVPPVPPAMLRVRAMQAGEVPLDGYGKPLMKNDRGEFVNKSGDTPCPKDGEMTNRRCWKCGWIR